MSQDHERKEALPHLDIPEDGCTIGYLKMGVDLMQPSPIEKDTTEVCQSHPLLGMTWVLLRAFG